ncbi:hypothetical protein FALCPG4_016791 [Fusarium falciforme]
MATLDIPSTKGSAAAAEPTDTAELLRSIVTAHPSTISFLESSPNVQATRSVLVLKPEHLPNSLMGSTLAASDAVAEPYVFKDDNKGALLAFYYLGRRLAGHVGIVHGGITAALLDECMGRATFGRLPGKIAVTAKLEIEYKDPISLDSVITIRADTIEVQGRKAWVEAKVQDAVDGRIVALAKGLFIQPKWADDLVQLM